MPNRADPGVSLKNHTSSKEFRVRRKSGSGGSRRRTRGTKAVDEEKQHSSVKRGPLRSKIQRIISKVIRRRFLINEGMIPGEFTSFCHSVSESELESSITTCVRVHVVDFMASVSRTDCSLVSSVLHTLKSSAKKPLSYHP